MPRLNAANSGVDSKRSLLKARCVSRAPVALLERPSAMLIHQSLPGQLRIGQALADNLR